MPDTIPSSFFLFAGLYVSGFGIESNRFFPKENISDVALLVKSFKFS